MPPEVLLETYALSPAGYAFAAIFGALFGSFANVCIYRMPPSEEHPKGQSVVSPGSHCFGCGSEVRWYDNIPILSYFLLRGRCRHCGAEFSPRYMLVEAATAMLFAATYHLTLAVAYPGEPLGLRLTRFGILAALVFVLVIITFIDLDHQLILDKITYPSIPLFYGLGLLLPETLWWHGLLGAAVGYGGVRLIADGYYYLTGREGMGYGDGKLLAIIGALFGWHGVVVSLFAGSLLGSVIGISVLVVMRFRHGAAKSTSDAANEIADADDAAVEGEAIEEADEDVSLRHVALPFGPFLAAGAIVYAYAQPWIAVRFALFWGSG